MKLHTPIAQTYPEAPAKPALARHPSVRPELVEGLTQAVAGP